MAVVPSLLEGPDQDRSADSSQPKAKGHGRHGMPVRISQESDNVLPGKTDTKGNDRR